jgi:hypothetical protein
MPIGTAVRYLKKHDWEKAHMIVQEDSSTLGCWAHGIVHMQEGDVANARYWYRKAHRDFPKVYDEAAEIAALARAIKEGTE